MVDKQTVLNTVQTLPDSASWPEISDALLGLLAREGLTTDFVRLYRSQLTPEMLAEYEQPNFDVSLGDMIKELEARHASENLR
jgi:hypothetical protein